VGLEFFQFLFGHRDGHGIHAQPRVDIGRVGSNIVDLQPQLGSLTLDRRSKTLKALKSLYFFVKFSFFLCCMCSIFVI
jgi:hypothetical protein